ncbi:Farnesylcysteine lyase [Platanthera guangdongensis]|uniref:Farnesylcysteine lyase n=1 Tax=Platanthera guangdongensis TaxID=2320717 RepID=A0ABR2MET9_9ASPA
MEGGMHRVDHGRGEESGRGCVCCSSQARVSPLTTAPFPRSGFHAPECCCAATVLLTGVSCSYHHWSASLSSPPVITRINYGQDISISGLAGAVSLAGSDDGLWSVDGGNWQLAAGLISYSNASLHLNEEVISVTYDEVNNYVLGTANGIVYNCGITVIATPLDELNILFSPPVSIPSRRLQHTFTTFVRGLLNPTGATARLEEADESSDRGLKTDGSSGFCG